MDAEDDFEAQLRRGRTIRIVVVLGLLVAIAVALVIAFRSQDKRTILEREIDADKLPDDEYPAARRKVEEARAAIERDNAQFQVFAKPITRGTTRCTEVPKELLFTDLPNRPRTLPDLVFSDKGEPLATQLIVNARDAYTDTEKRLTSKTASKFDGTIEYKSPTGLAVFVEGRGYKPTITRGAETLLPGQYSPGSVKGVAYLYSYDRKKILCAVDVDVENAARLAVEQHESPLDVLWRDLRYAVLAKLAESGVTVP